MSINVKRDLTNTNFFCKAFKGSKYISGNNYTFQKLVIVCFGLRVDFNF